MKRVKCYLISLVCVSFFFQNGYGQQNGIDSTTNKETEFIEWFFKQHNNWPFASPKPDSIIVYYADKIHEPMLNEIKKELQKEINWDYRENQPIKRNSLILTSNERDTIIQELNLMKEKRWDKKILENGKILKRETIEYMFCNIYGQLEFFRKHPYGFYEFTQPIFLRNDSICIFYCGLSCGTLCSDDRLMIFKKEEGKWKEWITVFRIIS